MLFLSMFIMSCDSNKFSLETEVIPDIESVETASGKVIAVQYKLGNLIILDTLSGLNAAEILYLTEKRDKTEAIHLKINAGDVSKVHFYYTIGSISKKTKPVNFDILLKNVDSFPNVVWEYKDNKYVAESEEKEKIKVKKTEKGGKKKKKKK